MRAALPQAPPVEAEPLDAILADVESRIVPGLTHWNHPGFFGYFAISSSVPGILAETLSAAFNVNAMLWRTSPAATELEIVVLDWLRQLLGVPQGLFGVVQDTASASTLVALAAAREAVPGLEARRRGLVGQARLRLYASDQAHSSVEKAAIVLGVGQDGFRAIPVDDDYRMDVRALERAIAEDREAGFTPFAVTATAGTTSTTSFDPVPAIADLCARERLWLHVDAAYGSMAGALPERRSLLEGCERADSIVVNPHKWLFVPIDFSALYTRRPEVMRAAFSLAPDYLRTPEDGIAPNLMDYGVSLGRRFRALKLWMVMRAFGVEGIRQRLREPLRLARLFRGWVEADEAFEVVAPTPMSVVCFRARFPGRGDADADRLNQEVVEAVNATGEAFLSTTRLRGRLTLRLAVGNLRTTEQHVSRAWQLLRQAAAERRTLATAV
ncbi:MAG: pyridoxal phosphate-dependent decarboxylase family protein [Betaproteobacteria bacterium]